MRPFSGPEDLALAPFPERQREEVRRQLQEVAQVRLEDERERWGVFSFYLRTFAKDQREILSAIWGLRPWRMPLFLGRLTAAAAVSIVYFLLTSDVWALGAHLSWRAAIAMAILSIVAATAFIFSGQDLGRLGREYAWREQLARTRLVLLGTLALGMIALWLGLLLISLWGAWALPRAVLVEWIGLVPTPDHLLRYAVFAATVGVLGAALGGNLEEEQEIKAELFIDEEA
ncbi:MAG TPA: hypothetical protein EYP16_05270 [Candidatus Atribacteria bacterium]|nr:hypothetical protein [Candidatus Atribacteria bacterium]